MFIIIHHLSFLITIGEAFSYCNVKVKFLHGIDNDNKAKSIDRITNCSIYIIKYVFNI